MDKTSTPLTKNKPEAGKKIQPAQATIEFLRQFARVYMPVSNMPGLVLN